MERLTSLTSCWQTTVAENGLSEISLKPAVKTSATLPVSLTELMSNISFITAFEMLAELRPPLRERRDNLSALLGTFLNNILEVIETDTPTDKPQSGKTDWSNYNNWSSRMVNMLDQLVEILVLLSKADNELRAANTINQFKASFASAEKTKLAGEDSLLGAINSGMFGLAFAGAGTWKTVKSTALHMKTEASVVSDKGKLHDSVRDNKALIIDKTASMKKLETASINSSKKQQAIDEEIKTLNIQNDAIKAKLSANEREIQKAGADGDSLSVTGLTREGDELNARLKENTKIITAKEAEIKQLVRMDIERNKQREALEKEIHKLNASNDEIHVQLEKLNHDLSTSQHKLQKLQAESALLIQMQRPVSAIAEAEGQRQAAANSAQAKLLEENSRVFQQTAATEEDHKRKADALKEMIIKIVGDLINANNARISTTISLLTVRA